MHFCHQPESGGWGWYGDTNVHIKWEQMWPIYSIYSTHNIRSNVQIMHSLKSIHLTSMRIRWAPGLAYNVHAHVYYMGVTLLCAVQCAVHCAWTLDGVKDVKDNSRSRIAHPGRRHYIQVLFSPIGQKNLPCGIVNGVIASI